MTAIRQNKRVYYSLSRIANEALKKKVMNSKKKEIYVEKTLCCASLSGKQNYVHVYISYI